MSRPEQTKHSEQPERADLNLPLTAPDEATLLRLLVDAATGFAIFAIDLDGTILTWNPGVLNITGYEEHEFLGQDCALIFTPEDREKHVPEQERETARREGLAKDERWHLRKDGTRFFGSGFMHALYDESNDLKWFAKILRDQTGEKRHQEEMEAAVRSRTAAHQAVQRRLLTAEEEERRRISRELHDQTGQHLAGLGLGLKALEQILQTHCPPEANASQVLTQLRAVADELSRDIHQIAVDLRPTALDDLGLAASLHTYVDQWEAQTGVPVEMEIIGLEQDGDASRRLSTEVETTLYRIVQESLTNAAKYAVPSGATRISVTLQKIDGHVVATVEDDGPGFDEEEALRRGRLGLAGMRERMELLGGSLEVESAPGKGTTIYARISVVLQDKRPFFES